MAFTWVQPKNQGDKITYALMLEIRTNTDYLDDHAVSCLTYNGTVYLTQYTTYHTSRDITIYSSDQTSDRSSNFSPHCIGQTGPGP